VIRLAIADDQSLIRAGLRTLFEHTDDIEVVGEAADGLQALDLARRAKPDVFLLDIRMPVLDGIETTRRIAADEGLRAVRVIILTTFELDDYIWGALRAGASGFLLKDAAPEEILSAIRVVAAGEALLSPKVTRRLLSTLARLPKAPTQPVPSLETLTGREREILGYVGRGMSNSEIAAALVISSATVKTHVGHLFAKLAARDRAQLVVRAFQAGLFNGED
jgi:DNA-binding NarL/FixJ family response regulator